MADSEELEQKGEPQVDITGHAVPSLTKLFESGIAATSSLMLDGYKRVSIGDGHYAWRKPGHTAFSNGGPGGVMYVTYVRD